MTQEMIALKTSIAHIDIFPRLLFSEGKEGNKYYELTGLKGKFKSYDYGIKYYPKQNVCLIFNLLKRKELHLECSSISITEFGFDINIALANGCYYKNIANSEGLQEKIIIIRSELLQNVLQDIETYSRENEYDGKDVCEKKEDSSYIKHRKIESITRLVRDSMFSKKVLKAYNNECAICRCNIVEVLQAAHIVAVADGGSDNVENGICLCANHHLMFDRKVIKIDFNSLTLYDVKNDVQKMLWYQEFTNKYNSKIKEVKKCE